jgi:hypothetical protein
MVLSCSKEDPYSNVYVPPVQVAGRTYSAAEINAFKQMTLSTTGGKIIKWPGRVSFFLVDTGYVYMTAEVDSIVRELNLLLDTNLVVTRNASRANSNIQIYLTDRSTYIGAEPVVAPTLQNSNHDGLAYLSWNNDGVPYRGSAFVDMVRTAGDISRQRFIIRHEIMHALGFYSHVTTPGTLTIMFHEALYPVITQYTPFDKRMMQLLYNPSITAGMSEDEFNAAVRNL